MSQKLDSVCLNSSVGVHIFHFQYDVAAAQKPRLPKISNQPHTGFM